MTGDSVPRLRKLPKEDWFALDTTANVGATSKALGCFKGRLQRC